MLKTKISVIAEYARGAQMIIALGFLLPLIAFIPRTATAGVLSTAPNNLGLLRYWSFEDATGTLATDFSGKGSAGTLTNMESTDWVPGRRGTALSFDGVNEYVDTGSFTLPSAVSFCAWIRPSSLPSAYKFFVGNDNASGDTGFGIASDSSNYFYVAIKNGYRAANAAFVAGDWYHVCGTGSTTSDTPNLYINGVAQSGSFSAVSGGTNGGDLYIGSAPRAGVNANATIDEFRVYNRTLSSTEVTMLYASGLARQIQANRKNLVAHWSFEDNGGAKATDFSGKGNTALQVNMEEADWVEGRFGRALSFDGVNEYLTASTTDFVSGASARSISGWIYPTTSSATRVPFAYGTCGTGNDAKAFGVYLSTSDVLNFWGCGTGDFSTGVTISENTWTHIAVTYDGTNVKVFKDGVQAGATTARSLGSSVAFMQIGGASLLDPGNYYYPGLVDELYVYARALSDTEVASLYSARSANYGFNASRNAELTGGLAGLWSFNGADVSGATAYDRSGNGYNGTLTDGPATTIGRIGQALYFDGTDDRVVVTSASNITGGSGSKTFSAWVKTDSFPDNEASTYISKMYNATEVAYSQGIGKNGQLSFQTTNGVNFHAYQTSAGAVSTSTWNHIAFTYTWGTGSTAQFYVNGAPVAGSWTFGDGNVSFVDNANNLEFGRLGYNSPIYYRWLRGKLDEVRIYNRILTAGEINQLYLQGK